MRHVVPAREPAVNGIAGIRACADSGLQAKCNFNVTEEVLIGDSYLPEWSSYFVTMP